MRLKDQGPHVDERTAQPPDPRTEPLPVSPIEARVRMYRQGLGDCFLLTFRREGEPERHMLIDCGVLLGTPSGSRKMRSVAENIKKETKGRLDILVATHEHWDHVSGFSQAREIFDQIEVGEVWLAWTEDPNNKLAKELRGEREMAINALQMAVDQMPQQFAARKNAMQGLLEFFGEPLGAAGRRSTRGAMEYVASRQAARIRYCRPDAQPLALEGLEGVRFYVLGPPMDETLLKKSNPTKTGKEVYEIARGPSLADSFYAAVLGASEDSLMTGGSYNEPFDRRFRIPREEASQMDFFVQHYGFEDVQPHGQAVRRIDHDWLNVSSELALKLDNDTNNTSLVLAIELIHSGQVLLFPGDAQVGNWLSWQDLAWTITGANGVRRDVTTNDLLDRTTLYKVGHHGSHNATLREKGLELMGSSRLVAMIPVEKGMAAKKRWEMPFDALAERLEEKTRGRVIRLDDGLPDQPPHAQSGQPLLTGAEWQTFRSRTKQTKLFIDCLFPMP